MFVGCLSEPTNLPDQRLFALTSDSDQRAKRIKNGAIIKAILDNLRDVHILFSLDGAQVRYVNNATTAIYGFSAEELRQRPQLRFDCIHLADRDRIVESFNTVVRNRTPFRTEYEIFHSDGIRIRVAEDTRIITSSDGEELILTSIRAEGVTEIYMRHRHLKAQHAVANVLSSASNSGPAILNTLEVIGRELGWQICEHWVPVEDSAKLRLSQIWCAESLKSTDSFVAISRQLLLDRTQMTQGKVWTGGQPLWTATVVDSEPDLRREATAELGLKTSLSFPISDGDIDGGIVTLYSQESYEIDTDLLQTVSGIGIQVAQYLQRAQLIERHAAGEQRFRQLFERNEAVKLVINPTDGSIIDANPAAASFYGYSVEQLRTMKIWQINTLPENEVRDHMRTANDEQRNRFVFNHRLASGEIRQVEVHSSPLNLDGRELLYSTIFDITEKLRTEAALRESDERFRLVFQHTPTAIAIFDRQMRYLFATTAWIDEYRLRDRAVIGHSQFEFFPETSERWRDIYRRAMAGETVDSSEERVIRADGTIGWIRFIVSPWRTSQNTIGGVIVFTESITSEKISHDALRESEEKYRSLFENLIDGFALHKIVLDHDGNPIDYVFLEVNSVFEEMTGLKRGNLIGRCVTEVIPGIASAKEDWISKYGRVALNGETAKFESEAPELGRWFWISAYSPKPGYFVTVFEDITARKIAEAQLRDQQRSISALLGNLPGMAYRCKNTPDWPIEFVSEGCRQLTGYSASELKIGGSVLYNDLIHPDDRTMVWNEVQRGVELREAYRLTYRIITRNGEIKNVWEQGSAIFDAELNVVALEGFIADISEQKRAEEALQSREEHFRALIDNSSDVITLFDINGKFIYLSPSVERVLGYRADELRGTSIFRRLHRGDCRRVRETMRRALIKGADISVELRIRHKDGSWRILDTIGRNLLDDPYVGAIVFNSRDITERRELETERMQLAKAVEQATESIVISDIDGNIIYVNSAFVNVSGYSRDEVIGQNARILKSGVQSAEYYRDMWTTLRAGEPWVGRFTNKRKNGTLYEEECAISPIKDSAGKVINLVAVKRDVTKEVELEDRLRQAQKLEAVGRLASGIAHDFNNLLAGIRGFGELINLEADENPKLQDYSHEIIRAASRAADLTSQLLAFARKGNFLSVPMDIHAAINEVTSILTHTIDRRIEIQSELSAAQSFVKGDPSQIQSAILNLGVNARDAMPEGGRLIITTRNVYLDAHYCERHSLERGPGEYISITVSDTGVGIEDKILSHIFDPFFTTKEQGKGTGLGLAGVYGCVRSHAGCVEVASCVGKGSAFTLYFPVLEVTALPSTTDYADVNVDGRERILLVDDEEIVRNLAERMLTKAGYKIISCEDGEEAVQLYRTGMNAIDLVLLDMMMPKMNGRDTYAALKKFNPDVKVLIMSGFSGQDIQEFMQEGILGYIAKPFQMRAFLVKVREALDMQTKVRQL